MGPGELNYFFLEMLPAGEHFQKMKSNFYARFGFEEAIFVASNSKSYKVVNV